MEDTDLLKFPKQILNEWRKIGNKGSKEELQSGKNIIIKKRIL